MVGHESWLRWINTFEAGTGIEVLKDLGDGRVLSYILQELDSDAFRYLGERQFDGQSPSRSDNWILRHNDLKKIYKSLTEFLTFCRAAGHVESLPSPDLTSIAKYQNTDELHKLLNFVLCAAVVSKDRAVYLSRIRSLPESCQQSLLSTPILQLSDMRERGDYSGSLATDVSLDTVALAVVSEATQAEDLNDQLHEKSAQNLPNTLGQSNELKQLRRQYNELHNQFLMTENQLAIKTTEIIEKEAILQALRHQVAAAQRSVASRESDTNHEHCLEQVHKLRTINAKYQSKFQQIQSHTSVLEERILELENKNEILRRNAHLKGSREVRHPYTKREIGEAITEQDIPGSPLPERSNRHDSELDFTALASGSASLAEFQDDSKGMKYSNVSSQMEMAQDELNSSYRSKTKTLSINENVMRNQYIAKYQKPIYAYQHSTMNKRSGSNSDVKTFQHENAIITRAFYDLATRLQQSSLTLQRATASPQSFLSSRRLALGILAPGPRSKSS